MNYSYKRFDTLRYETEFYKCNNFGHVSRNFPMIFKKFNEPTYIDLKMFVGGTENFMESVRRIFNSHVLNPSLLRP